MSNENDQRMASDEYRSGMSRLNRMASDFSSLAEDYKDTVSKLERFQDENHHLRVENGKHQKTIKKKDKAIEEMTLQRDKAEENVQRVTGVLGDTIKRHEEDKVSLESVKNQLAKTEKEQNASKETIKRMTTEYAELTDIYQTLSSKHDSLTEECIRIKNENKRLNESLAKRQKILTDTQQTLEKTERQRNASEETVKRYLADIEKRHQQLSMVKQREKMLEMEINYLRHEIQKLKSNLEKSEEQKEGAFRRLSGNNPNIADLNEPYRPTKLAEISSELYDNEWADAFDILEKSYSEEESVAILLNIVMNTFHFCKKTIDDDWKIVFKWHRKYVNEDQDTLLWLKKNMEANVKSLLPDIVRECFEFLTLNTVDNNLKELMSDDVDVKAYMSTCVKLCMYMCVQDPPCVMYCPGWRSGRAEPQIPAEGDQKSKESKQEFDVEKQIKEGIEESHLVADAVDDKEEASDVEKRKLQKEANTSVESIQEKVSDVSEKTGVKPHEESKNENEAAEYDNTILSDGLEDSAVKPNDEIGNEKKAAENGRLPESERFFDKKLFREYTKSGKFISYIVWPILKLHDDGPVLCKGVAQGWKKL